MSGILKFHLILTTAFLFPFLLNAQQLLTKVISVEVSRQPVTKVLDDIGHQGGFYFSYNSNLIKKDSLVTLSVKSKTVRHVLDLLFRGSLQYKETSGYIILQPSVTHQNWYISGYVEDGTSGERLSNVSVYEPGHLAGTITNGDGYFRLLLKEKSKYPPVISINISRVAYADTSVAINTGYDQELFVRIKPVTTELEAVVVNYGVQKAWLAKLLISSRLKKQSLNLKNFLANKPFQFSFTPGIGTHGQLGAQVINKFSFNILGGYTAGTNGFELAGLFNINEKSVRYVQIGGLFNTVGGSVTGFQIGGLHNRVLDSVHGLQIAGLSNVVKGNISGVQISGLISQVSGNAKGTLITGLLGKVGKNLDGFQLSGIGSYCGYVMTGTQLSGIFNYTSHLKGIQIGLVNVADTADGYSIGILNINKKGYKKFSLSTNDVLKVNLAYKAGNRNLYMILMGGFNPQKNNKVYSLGYGIGNELSVTGKLGFISELTTHAHYIGTRRVPFITTLRCSPAIQLGKHLQLFAGPSFYVASTKAEPDEGYGNIIPERTLFKVDNILKTWIGWQAGISFY